MAEVADVRDGFEFCATADQIHDALKAPRVGTFNAGLNLLPMAWQNTTLAFEVDTTCAAATRVFQDGPTTPTPYKSTPIASAIGG